MKLAVTNLKKNKEINLPYIIAIVVITMMYYLVVSLLYNDGLKDIPSGNTINQCFQIAHGIIIILTFIFMVYINSFLIKKRLKEFGLYHILGLEKKHIIFVMLIENAMIFVIAVISGLVLGTVFGKLCFLILLKVCHMSAQSSYVLSSMSYLLTLLLFGTIFFICLQINVWIIIKNKTIDLLHGENYGEKKLKFTGLFALIGVLLLGGSYYTANTLETYMQAILIFFPAVFAVIIATYLLFVSGSIVLLNALKKNKRFYYKTKNFISTASLTYRMKQNAVGLANICILSTMAIVTAAGCASLYTGQEAILKQMYPYDLTIAQQAAEVNEATLKEMGEKYHITITDYKELESAKGAFIKKDNTVTEVSSFDFNVNDGNNISYFAAMSQEEYNRINHTSISLKEGQIILASLEDLSAFKNGLYAKDKYYEVVATTSEFPLLKAKYKDITDTIFMVFHTNKEAIAFQNMIYQNSYDDNKELTKEQYINYEGDEHDRLSFASAIISQASTKSFVSNIDTSRREAYGFYGGILFIGIFFIIIFLTITILIIYFKQVTEGYDDRDRFAILQKVGMDATMVKQAINQQILIVFFLPLIMALIHLIAASNLIKAMMTAFYLVDIRLILTCIGITSIIFAAIYIIVYKMTAKTYYKIVRFH